MNSASSGRDPVEELAEEFAARYRRGEHPAVTEYTDKHPDLAEQIRDLFPALVVMEQFGSVAGPRTGPLLSPAPESAAPPKQLGDYRILREVGRGGMGVVYEAVQESLGRHVALKILPFHNLMNPTHLERFKREARAAAQLHHTNIVPVFGVGEAEGIHYYAMQFIHGYGLDAVLEEVRRLRDCKSRPATTLGKSAYDLSLSIAHGLLTGRFRAMPTNAESIGVPDSRAVKSVSKLSTPSGAEPGHVTQVIEAQSELASQTESQYCRSVAQVGVQVAEALAYAHKQHILHRDIKPSNLLLDTQGTVWITDFGLAKAEGSEDLTSPGDIVGTVRFMAPERFQGKADPRSDVYSTGITLYEMLALRPAFADSNRARLIERISHEDPPRLRKLDPCVPRDLETLLMKALAKEPADRYANAEAMALDLRRFLNGEPIQARPVGRAERLWRWCWRHPALAGLYLVLFLAVLGSTLFAVYIRTLLEGSEFVRKQKGEAERQAKEQLFESLFVQAHANRFSGQPGQRMASLEALRRAAELGHELNYPGSAFAKLRNEAIACLALPDLRLDKQWEGNLPGTHGLALDARFERYARSHRDEGLHICRVADHEELLRIPTLPAETNSRWLVPRFSTDGRFLGVWYQLWGKERPLQVWAIHPGVPQLVMSLADSATPAAFSGDGRTVAAGLPDRSLVLWDLATGQETNRYRLDVVPEYLAFHPSERKMAVASKKHRCVQIRDLSDGRVLQAMHPGDGVVAVAWHPNGRLIATACDDFRIYLWESVTGRKSGILEGHRWGVSILAFDQRGDQLASFGWDMTLRIWDVATHKQLLTVDNVRVTSFSQCPDLRVAGITGRQVRVWTSVPSASFRVLHGHTASVLLVAFSPDDRWLESSSSPEDAVILWDVARKGEAVRLSGASSTVWRPTDQSLIMAKPGQVQRCSFEDHDRQGSDKFTVGPTEDLVTRDGPRSPGAMAWCGKDARLLAVCDHDSGLIQAFRLGRPISREWIRTVPHVLYLSASADGRWLAAGTQDGGHGIFILDANSGEVVHELPLGDAMAVFSPAGPWLVTTTGRLTTPEGECCLWRAGTWEKVLARPLSRTSSSPATITISRDGRILAIARTESDVQLLHLETLEEIATLSSPEPGYVAYLAFSSDSRRLSVAVANTVQLWDLEGLRRALATLGLDWE